MMREANYRDSMPRSYGHEEISYWGLELSALIDPWEWEAAVQENDTGWSQK